MIHELVELVKALVWPCVVTCLVLKFQTEIRALLHEMPSVVRRMRSAHGLGVEIELEKIEDDLPIAELQAQLLSLKLPSVPSPAGIKETS